MEAEIVAVAENCSAFLCFSSHKLLSNETWTCTKANVPYCTIRQTQHTHKHTHTTVPLNSTIYAHIYTSERTIPAGHTHTHTNKHRERVDTAHFYSPPSPVHSSNDFERIIVAGPGTGARTVPCQSRGWCQQTPQRDRLGCCISYPKKVGVGTTLFLFAFRLFLFPTPFDCSWYVGGTGRKDRSVRCHEKRFD